MSRSEAAIVQTKKSDPFAALQAYKKRNIVELDFSQYKNWVDGDRLRCTNKSYLGKLFVCTIAASLRGHDDDGVLRPMPRLRV